MKHDYVIPPHTEHFVMYVYVYMYTGCRKNPCPNFKRSQGGPKQRFMVIELYVRDAPSQH